MSNTTKVELTFWVKGVGKDGKSGKPGDVIELPENQADILIRDHKAKPYEAPVASDTPEAVKAKPKPKDEPATS